MSTVSDSTFGTLLRRFRLDAQLSQEELGARANLSVETIGALERGARRAPYRTTVDLLARGLGLSLPELAVFEEAAARARARPRLNAPILSATLGNLPSAVTSFVGRDTEIRELRKLLSEYRLVTITGTGGIGKTRTALQVGAELGRAYVYGVWFVELATIDAGGTIATRIASALRLRLQEDQELDSLARELRSRSLLLIIDNCEHLLESAASIIAVLLRECPRLRIIATSRERLALTGEIVFRMPSLALPPADEHISVAQARSFAAIRLFLERAQLVDIRFSFEEKDVSPVLNICRRLDGVALAIEIAAARSQLGLGALEELICRNAITVSSDLRDVSSRHQTIAATITWSYRLLSDREQRILRYLSIFTGSFTVDAAVAICASEDLESSALPTLLEALCEKSLLNRGGEDEPRFVLSQSIRDFASREPGARGEAALTAARHGEYYAAFADGLREKRNTLTRAQMIPYVASEIDNIDAAIERNLQDGGDAVVAARIMSGLRFYWRESGRVREAVRKATTLIERLDAGAYPALVASLHLVREFGLVGIERVNENLRAIELLSGVRDAGLMADAFMRLGDAYRLIKLATKRARHSDGLGPSPSSRESRIDTH